MEPKKDFDIWAFLLAIASAIAILVFIGGGAIMLASGFANGLEAHRADPFRISLYLTAFLLVSLLVGRVGLLSLRRLRNRPDEAARIQPLSIWMGLALFVGWIFSIALAAILNQNILSRWFALPFYLSSIGIPVYALIRLAAGGLALGSNLRAWGSLSAGMTLAPFLSILAEGLALLLIIIVFGIFAGLDPRRMQALQSLMEQLQHISSQEEALALLGPYLTSPLVLLGGLFFLSVVTPLIEETAKSLAVWMAWRKLTSPAQGFAIGALSGAGFALMEGLFVSAAPNETWGMTLAVRAASSSMHIFTSGMIGWGIGLAAAQKRVTPALGRYALGIAFHALWNAPIVLIVFASGRMVLSPAGASFPNIAASLLALSGFCFLGLLILAAPLALWALNRQLRRSQPASALVEIVETPPSENMVG